MSSHRKAVLSLLILASATLLAACPGGGNDPGKGPSPLPRSRLVSVGGSMAITDHENIVANEHHTASFNNTVTVGENQATQLLSSEACAGDEVRIVVELNASLAPAGDAINISGNIRMFEGTSCTTTDQDGVRTVNFTVLPDQTITQQFTVNNDDEGDDTASVTVTVSNFKA
jgi:hypothetical protein